MSCHEPLFYFLPMNLSMLFKGDPVLLKVNGFGGWPKTLEPPKKLNYKTFVLYCYFMGKKQRSSYLLKLYFNFPPPDVPPHLSKIYKKYLSNLRTSQACLKFKIGSESK